MTMCHSRVLVCSRSSLQMENEIMTEVKYPSWQVPYQAALLETNVEKLKIKAGETETAIFLRVQALNGSSDHHAERQAIQDALAALRLLQTEKLGYPRLPRELEQNQ